MANQAPRLRYENPLQDFPLDRSSTPFIEILSKELKLSGNWMRQPPDQPDKHADQHPEKKAGEERGELVHNKSIALLARLKRCSDHFAPGDRADDFASGQIERHWHYNFKKKFQKKPEKKLAHSQ